MKLIFSLDPLAVSMTGIGRYTYELAKGLRDSHQFTDIRYQYLLGWVDEPDTIIRKYHFGSKPHEGNPQGRFQKWTHHLARTLYTKTAPALKGLVCLPFRNYIFHSPNFAIPYYSGRLVSTIHDMSVFRVPQYHPEYRVKYQQAMFPSLLKRGDLFITVSEFSKLELMEIYRVPQERVVSIPNGVDPIFHPRLQAHLTPLLAQYGLEFGSYLLSVGTIEPRKNVERLIDAYASLPKAIQMQYPLVLVGGHGWNSEPIHDKIAKYREEGWLKYLLFVPDGDLASIYAGARIFACVSHYEGFGLPVLEAMASGIPVISSTASALVEVAGDAALYVDPNSVESIREAIKQAFMGGVDLEDLSRRGIARARQFTWAQTTQATIDAYRMIA